MQKIDSWIIQVCAPLEVIVPSLGGALGSPEDINKHLKSAHHLSLNYFESVPIVPVLLERATDKDMN